MALVSTRSLGLLLPPDRLERLSQSIALLDAILCEEWEPRYYSFNRRWDAERGERMASMRNGSGDDYFLVFSTAGAILKGFAHEYPMASLDGGAPGMLDAVPDVFAPFLAEPAFSMENVSFCVWHVGGAGWQRGPVVYPEGHDPDGSEFLLALLDGDPSGYRRYAADYFELDVPLAAIERIYRHERLTTELLAELAPERTIESLQSDLDDIGYQLANNP